MTHSKSNGWNQATPVHSSTPGTPTVDHFAPVTPNCCRCWTGMPISMSARRCIPLVNQQICSKILLTSTRVNKSRATWTYSRKTLEGWESGCLRSQIFICPVELTVTTWLDFKYVTALIELLSASSGLTMKITIENMLIWGVGGWSRHNAHRPISGQLRICQMQVQMISLDSHTTSADPLLGPCCPLQQCDIAA